MTVLAHSAIEQKITNEESKISSFYFLVTLGKLKKELKSNYNVDYEPKEKNQMYFPVLSKFLIFISMKTNHFGG